MRAKCVQKVFLVFRPAGNLRAGLQLDVVCGFHHVYDLKRREESVPLDLFDDLAELVLARLHLLAHGLQQLDPQTGPLTPESPAGLQRGGQITCHHVVSGKIKRKTICRKCFAKEILTLKVMNKSKLLVVPLLCRKTF